MHDTDPHLRAAQSPTIGGTALVAPLPIEVPGPSLRHIRTEQHLPPVRLVKSKYVIGRSDDADIRIESKLASRHHAVLSRQDDDFVVTDLDSMHGVYLNGVRIQSAVLRDFDVLQIGDELLSFAER